MSRAHAVAPLPGSDLSRRAPADSARRNLPLAGARLDGPEAHCCYVERALLLWPRLDRARLRRVADNPTRIAELIERRTSQPFDVILAMLTSQTDRLTSPTESTLAFDSGRADAARAALRVVRSDGPVSVESRDQLPA